MKKTWLYKRLFYKLVVAKVKKKKKYSKKTNKKRYNTDKNYFHALDIQLIFSFSNVTIETLEKGETSLMSF